MEKIFLYIDGHFFKEFGHRAWHLEHKDSGAILQRVSELIGGKPIKLDMFKGRMSAASLDDPKLAIERDLDLRLIGLGVELHYLPLECLGAGKARERGVDVMLASTMVHDACVYRPDKIGLIAGDVDYVPAVRVLQKIAPVHLIAAQFTRQLIERTRETRTSAQLIATCSKVDWLVHEEARQF